MATVKVTHQGNHEGFAVRITGTQSGQSFTFFCRPPRVIVSSSAQTNGVASEERADWFESLTKEERFQVFRLIADHYNQYSHASLKTAAIGVVRNPNESAPNNQKHFLFLGINTERRGSDYFKDCAEQNMVNAATIAMAQRLGKDGAPNNRVPIELEAIAISGYRPADATGPAITATCPCGKCTDMLGKVMNPTGEVYVLPRVPPLVKPQINSTAKIFSAVGKTEIWDTTLDSINLNRHVKLNSEDASLQKKGKDYTVQSASQQSAKERANTDEIATAWLERSSEIAKKNALSGRVSVAELDAAYDKHGHIDPSLINRFMQQKIESTLANRLVSDRIQGNLSAAKEFVDHPKFKHIRCVVLRMDDNTMHYGIESDTPIDNAAPNAEVSALTHALEGTGTHGVREMWAMELNPKQINQGVMQTSAKEGLERLLKRRSRELPIDKIQFHYVPMNDGKLDRAAAESLIKRHTYTTDTIYPGLFTGNSNKAAKIAAKPKDGGDLPPK